MGHRRGRDRRSTLNCWSLSWTSSTCWVKMSKTTLISLHRVRKSKTNTHKLPFLRAQTFPYCIKNIEKPQTHWFCHLIFFFIFFLISQTARATGLRGRWQRWWRIWCSSLRRCCKNFTAERSWETMKTCSTFWQIRSGRWEKPPGGLFPVDQNLFWPWMRDEKFQISVYL